MLAHLLTVGILLAAPAAGRPSSPPAAQPAPTEPELADLVPLVRAERAVLKDVAQRLLVARLRASAEKERVLQEQCDTADRLQDLIDSNVELQLMPHEVARLRAEQSLLEDELETAEDESARLRNGLTLSAIEQAEQPWSARRSFDARGLVEAARDRAVPGARDSAHARVDVELGRIARAEHHIDDLDGTVIPDAMEALRSALVDLPDGGAMLDVLEANQRLTDARRSRVRAALEREIALIRLALLTGNVEVPHRLLFDRVGER